MQSYDYLSAVTVLFSEKMFCVVRFTVRCVVLHPSAPKCVSSKWMLYPTVLLIFFVLYFTSPSIEIVLVSCHIGLNDIPFHRLS